MQELIDTAVDTAVTSAATKTMTCGGMTAAYGWVTSNEGIAIIGLVLTIIGFVINLIFQLRRDRRETALHKAELSSVVAALSKKNSPKPGSEPTPAPKLRDA